jgi:hypothetical protein
MKRNKATQKSETSEALEPNANVLRITRDESKTEARQMAESKLSPVVYGTASTLAWGQKSAGPIDINEAVAVIEQRATDVQAGDLSGAKAMLIAQAGALDAIFMDLSIRAANSIKTEDGRWSFDGTTVETLLRLAFKAQSQSRATLQTLGELANPRAVAFIQQANMANGPQQVNNGSASGDKNAAANPPAHGETKSPQSKLLERTTDGSQTLDARTARTAATRNQSVETLGAIHGSQKPRGKGKG